jgi:multimeric flavodoxin WrbA
LKVIAVNGSPRKDWNTAAMLRQALQGSADRGAITELIHLYELDYRGCSSCFACKTRGGPSYGRCALQDDLAPVLQRIEKVGALILGSPIYFGQVTGGMRSFLERLLFSYLRYSRSERSLFPGKMDTAWIYTMNCPEASLKDTGYDRVFAENERLLKMIFGGSCYTLTSHETLQFADYSKVDADMFDPAERKARHERIFPRDCARAYDLGARLASSL